MKRLCFELKNRFFSFRAGISIIEIIVMAGIITVLTAVLIGGFPAFNETTYAKKEAERLALDLRVSQNNAILGKVAQGAGTVPSFWGLHADLISPGQYILFADSNGNHLYDSGVDEILSTKTFENGIQIINLTTNLSSSESPESVLDFVFSVPNGDTEVRDTSARSVSYGQITLAATKTAYKRVVTMRVSGQISITPN